MNLREFYTELVRHANGGLSGDTEMVVLVDGAAVRVEHIYWNGKELVIFPAKDP